MAKRDRVRVTKLDVKGEELFVIRIAPEVRSLEALSQGEREVAGLLLDGLSNAEIAEIRGTSTRTVANQVASIFKKLGVRSRTELAAGGLAPHLS